MTGDPRRDAEATPHHWGGSDEPVEDEYAQHAREEREAEQRERMDAAYEQAKAEDCHHCHDDPPRGHVCPACGREASDA